MSFFALHLTSLEHFIARCADVICCREYGYASLSKGTDCSECAEIMVEPYSLPGMMVFSGRRTEVFFQTILY